jgi:hypothetical protein
MFRDAKPTAGGPKRAPSGTALGRAGLRRKGRMGEYLDRLGLGDHKVGDESENFRPAHVRSLMRRKSGHAAKQLQP